MSKKKSMSGTEIKGLLPRGSHEVVKSFSSEITHTEFRSQPTIY